MNLKQTIRRILSETLESKWNKGKYDYQYGFCHYFAYNLIDKIRERFPNKNVNYYLLLGNEIDKKSGENVNDYLIHVYIKIDDMLLDSNGITTIEQAKKRAKQWAKEGEHKLPDTYTQRIWEEESDEIPEVFFNNSFCNTSRVKKDLKDFLSNPIVQRILRDK